MLSDPVADLLTRIRNAYAVNNRLVVAPYSKLKENLVKIMVEHRYLKSFKVVGDSPQLQLEIVLKYPQHRSAVTAITRISKPGVRTYAAVKDFSRLKRGRGITIISTSKGVMTLRQAQKKNLGGEVVCKIS